MLNGPRTNIGLKIMGELDNKVFVDAWKKKFPLEEAGTKGAVICSLWQENLKNSAWHPFKVVKVDDKLKVCPLNIPSTHALCVHTLVLPFNWFG